MPIEGARDKDFPQVLKESYDPNQERIRVDALINDGQDALVINPDGSINVNVVDSPTVPGEYVSSYNEITSVPSSTPSIINTYTVPIVTNAFLQKIEVAGTNIAMFEVLINGVVQNKMYTYFGGNLNAQFNFADILESGYPVSTGDSVSVRVTHVRPDLGNFNARIQAVEIP